MDSGKCIDAVGGGNAGTRLGIWDCNGQGTQKWGYDANSKTIYLATSDASLCMDVVGGSVDDGTKVQVWNCNGHTNQAFDFNGGPAPAPSPPTPSDSCLNHLNGLRAQHGLKALYYNTGKQSCVDWQAQTDSAANQPHKTAGKCGEVSFPDPSGSGWSDVGQCEAQGQQTCEEAIDSYYSEGPTGPGIHGHYQVIMSSYAASMTYKEITNVGQFGTWWTHSFFGFNEDSNSTFALV